MRSPESTFTKSIRVAVLLPWLGVLSAAPALGAINPTQPDSTAGDIVEEPDPPEAPPRGFPTVSIGLDFVGLSPQGEFSRYVDHGLGILGNLRGSFGRSGTLGVRLDAGLLNYGVEITPLNLGRVWYEVQTENNVYFATLGPQVEMGGSDVRLYGTGFVGFSYFATESRIIDWPEAPYSVNFEDLVPAYGVGGGILVKLGRGRSPAILTLGVRYQMHPTTRYLTEGGIVDAPDGTYLFPVESRTDMLLIQVGVGIGGFP